MIWILPGWLAFGLIPLTWRYFWHGQITWGELFLCPLVGPVGCIAMLIHLIDFSEPVITRRRDTIKPGQFGAE